MHVIIRSRLYLKHAETLPLYQWSGSILTFFPITMVQNMNNQESRHKYWATRSSIRSFARITHSFACLLAHSLPSLWGNKMIQWLFLLIFSVLDHSTTRPRLSLVTRMSVPRPCVCSCSCPRPCVCPCTKKDKILAVTLFGRRMHPLCNLQLWLMN